MLDRDLFVSLNNHLQAFQIIEFIILIMLTSIHNSDHF